MVGAMGTIASILLIVAIILGIIAIVCAVTHRPWTNFVWGAVIAFVIYLVLVFVVH